MLDDDIIKTRFISRVDGENCSNTIFWKVLSPNDTDSLAETLLKLATAWWDAVKVNLSNEAILICADWDNQTQNEQAVVYPNLIGSVVEDTAPALSILSIHCEGWESGDPTPRTVTKLRNSISGWAKSKTTRGRLAAADSVVLWEVFMKVSHLLDTGEAHLVPMCRHDSAGKAWRDAGSVPPQPAPVYAYYPIQTAHVNRQVKTLPSRKSKIC